MQPTKKQKQKPKQKRPKNSVQQPSNRQEYKAPVAITRVIKTPAPKIARSLQNGDVTVTHSEFLGDINGSVPFTLAAYPINPGVYSTFPWLSQMATLYESYKFERLDFEFVSETNTMATGAVMGVVDYDPSDPSPTTKVQMSSYRGYVRSSPWKSFLQKSLREDISKRNSYFVRNGGLPAGQDLQLFDTGNFFIATEKQADTSPVGELYVHYRVKLMTPQLNNPGVGAALSSRMTWVGATVVNVAGSKAPLVPSGDSASNYTLTATGPYQCLLVLVAVAASGLTGVTTAGTTATIQGAQVSSSGTQVVYSAQVSFLPGQVFTAAPNVATTQGNIQVGQYDVLTI